jgi:hypothetical protein
MVNLSHDTLVCFLMMRRNDHAQCCIKDYRELETHNLAVVR